MEGTLRLDLKMETYVGFLGNIDEYGLPNAYTLLDREASSSVIGRNHLSLRGGFVRKVS